LLVARRLWLRQQALAQELEGFSSLAELLKIDMATKAYASFVAAEFSGESLAFYLRVRAFKNNGTTLMVTSSPRLTAPKGPQGDRIILLSQPGNGMTGAATKRFEANKISVTQQLLREANQIYRAFVVDGAPFEVNLSSVTKSSIANQLQQLTNAVATSQREKLAAIGRTPNGNGSVAVDVNHSPVTVPSGNSGSGGISDADLMLIQSILNVYDEANLEVIKLMEQNSFKRKLFANHHCTSSFFAAQLPILSFSSFLHLNRLSFFKTVQKIITRA
jgi:hypothetical protein